MKIRWQCLAKAIFLILFFMGISLNAAESSYILCIDGGGSKTILQVIDQEGKVIPLIKDDVEVSQIATTGSNLNTVGVEGVKAVLRDLFENIKISKENKDLVFLLPSCQVVAGIAGTALPKNKQIVISLFEEWGIKRNHLFVMSDAELALQLIKDRGIILIAGTGSICFAKNNQALFRVGGLGRVLGDEGSGYQIGLQALKAALAEEYGWGESTALTVALRNFFRVDELKSLIPQVNLGQLSPAVIASIVPLVFKIAEEGDKVSKHLIQCAASDLGNLLLTMLKMSGLSDCEVHLWGGLFKSTYSDAFVQKMMEQVEGIQANLRLINHAHDHAAVLFASKFLLPTLN